MALGVINRLLYQEKGPIIANIVKRDKYFLDRNVRGKQMNIYQ